MDYLELVIGQPSNRPGKCIEQQELNIYKKKWFNNQMYRSVFTYKEPFTGSVSSYAHDYGLDIIPLDIDYEKSDKYTLEKVYAVIELLKDLNIDDRYIIFYSGTGYHIMLANLFGFHEENALPMTVKHTLEKIFNGLIDSKIYMKTGIYRINNTRNLKSNLFKVPLHHKELNIDKIKEIAQKPRWDFDYSDYNLTKESILNDLIIHSKPQQALKIQEVHQPSRIATCIHNIYEQKPVNGIRHEQLLRLSSHFRRKGLPSSACSAACESWLNRNNDNFNQNEFENIINNTYKTGYKYSCNDPILARFCSPQCIYYTNKDYNAEVQDAQEMHDNFVNWLNTDFTGKVLQLDKIFDCSDGAVAYPGEFVTLFGLTGTGKTALAQSIAIGLTTTGKFINDKLSTLYISMEMSAQLMYRRWFQMIRNMTKNEAIHYHMSGKNGKPVAELSNVLLRQVSPSLKTIEEEIRKYDCRLVIIDYIELLKVDEPNERKRITTITRFLTQLALKYNIIIMALSQVGRAYSREEVLDLYAGKESGSIETDSSKVIGIWGSNNSPYKKIEFFKNRDSDILDVTYVEMISSMRFRKSTEEKYSAEREKRAIARFAL